MKTKAFAVVVAMTLLAAGPAFAQRRGGTTGMSGGRTVVRGGTTVTSGGRTFVGNRFHRPYCGGGGVTWSVGIGFPFYGGYYGGYPYYANPYYGGYYPYGGYGYGYYPYSGYGYSGGYYGASSGYYGGSPGYYGGSSYGRQVYEGRSGGSTVARVQERLARAGYYSGGIDGVMGPRTRSAVRAYERRHGLPVDGVIDRQLLATMGLA